MTWDITKRSISIISPGSVGRSHVSNTKPVGEYYLPDLERAGGMPAIMSVIREVLDGSQMTISGRTIAEICEEGKKKKQFSKSSVIQTMENPVMDNGGIIVLKGNLAESAIVRAFKHSKNKFIGRAKVFNSQLEAMKAVEAGKVKKGDVLVLRFMGPKGGPECLTVLVSRCSCRSRAGRDIAVITDGRFSGFARV